jgi:glycosyltransferase involved in cell wall biosynthesis
MKVTGFTFIKDAVKYDYPIVESILSILTICDEFIVAVGKSNDETLALIQSIPSNKIRIIETVWDETMREGGVVLAQETNKAYEAISNDTDWAFYIQGDEIIHEQYLPEIVAKMKMYKDDKGVDGLLFDYLHFYGSYDFVATSSIFYLREVRIIRKRDTFFSYLDAQGFRKKPNDKLCVVPLHATVYHYGWVKTPASMQIKQLNFNKYWHQDDWIETHIAQASEYDFSKLSSLKQFGASHPQVMQERIKKMNWTFDFDISKSEITLKDYFKKLMWKYFKWDINYKNYKIIRE